jgi:hypothetical protein
MIISDLVTDKEVQGDSVDSDKWCSCIDGALTKENYLESIRKAGFQNPKILDEKLYTQEESDGNRKISSIIVKAINLEIIKNEVLFWVKVKDKTKEDYSFCLCRKCR